MPVSREVAVNSFSHAAIRRNFSWSFTGNIIYSICQWGLISVLAKLTTPEVVGEYALGVAITAPLLYIANFSIGVMFVTDAAEEFKFRQYWAVRFLLTLITSVAALAICLISRFPAHMFFIVMLTSLSQSVECMSELYRMVMLRSEAMAPIAFSLITRGVVSVSAAAFVLYQTKNLPLALTALVVGRTAVLVAYDIPVGRRLLRSHASTHHSSGTAGENAEQGKVSGSLRALIQITSTALPLTIVTVLTSLVLNTPRYFIEHYAGRRELGIFAAMWSLLTAGNMIAISLGQAIFPRLARLYADQELDQFRHVMAFAIKAGAGLGICGIVCAKLVGRQVLTIAYGPEYAKDQWMFVAIMATGTFLYLIIVFGNVATSARAFRQQAILMALVAAATLAASGGLVPRLGVWGAILAINAGLVIHLAGLVFIVAGLLKRKRGEPAVSSVLQPEHA